MVELGRKARLLLLRTAVPGGHPAPPRVWLCARMWDGGHSADSKGHSVWDEGFQRRRERKGEAVYKEISIIECVTVVSSI